MSLKKKILKNLVKGGIKKVVMYSEDGKYKIILFNPIHDLEDEGVTIENIVHENCFGISGLELKDIIKGTIITANLPVFKKMIIKKKKTGKWHESIKEEK